MFYLQGHFKRRRNIPTKINLHTKQLWKSVRDRFVERFQPVTKPQLCDLSRLNWSSKTDSVSSKSISQVKNEEAYNHDNSCADEFELISLYIYTY